MSQVIFDEDWLKKYCKRTGKPMPDLGGKRGAETAEAAGPKRSKYGNEKTTRYGRTFDSKHEADVCDELMILKQAKEVYGIFAQVAFELPGGVKYIADFVTLNPDGTYTVIDAKSEATAKDKAYRIKRRQMKECLGIEIQER